MTMASSFQRSLWAVGDFFSSKSHVPAIIPYPPTGLALITLDYERECDVELEIIREKLNKIAKNSTTIRHLLLWDRLQSILEAPFHHIMQIMQKNNVQGLCIVLHYTAQQETLRTLRKICSCLWSKHTVAIEDQCCPPLPICIIVHGSPDKLANQLLIKRLILLEIAPILPTVDTTVPKDLHFIKIKFCVSAKEIEFIAEQSADWLKQVAKRYGKYCEGKSIWGLISWEKILRRERLHTWKNVAKSFGTVHSRQNRFKLKRSQSEPAIAPRRKPFIHDEIGVSFGEEAAAIAVQMKHFHNHDGIWSYKYPRTMYLHRIFVELIHLRESMRIKLIHRRQYFQRTGMHRAFTSPVERFYTRFQWIKSFSHDMTDQLVIYFHYGSVIQFNIARMKEPLTPCDIQILRNHLLAHSAAKKLQAKMSKTKNMEELYRRLQPKIGCV